MFFQLLPSPQNVLLHYSRDIHTQPFHPCWPLFLSGSIARCVFLASVVILELPLVRTVGPAGGPWTQRNWRGTRSLEKQKVRAKSNADADNVFFSGYSGLFGVAQRHREWEFGASVRVRNHSNSSPRALTAYSKRRERRR